MSLHQELTTEQRAAYIRFLAAKVAVDLNNGVQVDERIIAKQLVGATDPSLDPAVLVSAFFTIVQATQHGASCQQAVDMLTRTASDVAVAS